MTLLPGNRPASRFLLFKFLNLLIIILSLSIVSSSFGEPVKPICKADFSARQTNLKSHKKSITICVDPGHPSDVNSGFTVQNGTTETHIDWVVAKKLEILLMGKGFRVVLTKNSEKKLVKNRARAEIANRVHAELLVRLHCDTGQGSGYAIYYPDRTGTIGKVTGPNQAVRDASHECATTISQEMEIILKGDLKSNGIAGDSKTFVGRKQGALTGSVFSKVPVVTIEMATLSQSDDAEFIKTEAGQDKIATAIAAGIERIFREKEQLQQGDKSK